MHRLLLGLATFTLLAQQTGDLTQALKSARQRIDDIDSRIVELLNQRAGIVREVGLIKKRFHAPVSAPGREEAVLLRVSSLARDPLTGEEVKRIYRSIIAEMTSMEQREIEKASYKSKK